MLLIIIYFLMIHSHIKHIFKDLKLKIMVYYSLIKFTRKIAIIINY